MKTNDPKEQLLKAAQTQQDLETIITELANQKLSKQEIYDLIHELYQQTADNSPESDVLLDALDRLSGWCSPGQEILPDEPLDHD